MHLRHRASKVLVGAALVASLTLQLPALAHPSGKVDVVASGRDSELIAQYWEDAEHISQVAESLGYRTPPVHRLTFVPSGELGEMSAIGHYPLPHWHDGAEVFQSMSKISGVLEFVTRGNPVARSFYSDTSDYWEQLSIIMHVMGHNDFALNSSYIAGSQNDTMATSLALAQKISTLYEFEHEEVSQYIQWLHSMLFMQDFVEGSYDAPEKFKRAAATTAELMAERERLLSTRQGLIREGTADKVSTASIFSAFVHNLPLDAPVWQHEVTAGLEEMTRHYQGSVQTKTMNEGWATFSQFLLVKHSRWRERTDSFVDLGGLMSGVAVPSLSNPYWLGLECWQNLYRRFTERPEIARLDELARDRAFVEEAHRIMAWTNNYEFIRLALDAQWVEKLSLILERPSTEDEIAAVCGDDWECRQKLSQGARTVLTRNPERIINYIARKQADLSVVFPRIKLKSFNEKGSGALRLVHEVAEGIPLKLHTAVQTQLVMSLIMGRPVSLETIHYRIHPEEPATLVREPIKITVHPGGQLNLVGEGSEALQVRLAKSIAEYMDDLMFSESDRLSEKRRQHFSTEILANVTKSIFSPVNGSHLTSNDGKFLSHSPTSGAAVLEYKAMLEERFARMLHLAVTGQIGSQKGKAGVSFRVMPLIPQFELDDRVHQRLLAQKPPAPVDDRSSLPRQAYVFGEDDTSSLGQDKQHLPGDIYQKPKDEEGGGSGEGDPEDGEPEDGEEGEEPSDGSEAGQGGQDPSMVEISLQDWGKALQEEIGLPNLRRTLEGESTHYKKRKRGTKRREYGDVVYRKMLPRALGYPISDNVLAGEAIQLDDIVERMIDGFSRIRPADFVVKNRREVPLPSNKAVIVVVMDFSGSMAGDPHKMAANLVYNFKALLLSQYEEVKFRYVVYDTTAHEFSEDDVFGKKPKFLGGGTSNVVGYEMAETILSEYNYDEWNKYVLGMGDAGAPDGVETSEVIERLYPDTQSISFVYTNNGYFGDPGFLTAMRELADRLRWVGFAELGDAKQGSIIRVLKELFPAQN